MQDNILGKRLRELRQERDKTIYNVADDLYLSASVIGCYERGTNDPPLERVAAFAIYYGVSTDYLLGLSDNRVADGDKTGFSDEIMGMLHYLSGIPWAKEMVSDTIRAIMGGVASQKLEEHFQKAQTEYAE